MAKKKQAPTTDDTPESKPAAQAKPVKKKKVVKQRTAGEVPWHPAWRGLASLLVVLHLLAVFSAPWDLATQPTLPPGDPPLAALSPEEIQQIPPAAIQQPVVTRSLRGFFHNYLNLLYLNHGYEFFAPDPSGTQIIDYQVTQTDGQAVEGRMPSHDQHWPRLLYHRHMMLAEQTSLAPDSANHYAQHLADLHNGNSRLQLKQHMLLLPQQVADGTTLDDPTTYRPLGEVTGRPKPAATTDISTPLSEVQQ